MTAEDFNGWLAHMGLNDSQATQLLGLGSRNTVAKYKAEGAPLYIALACTALAAAMPAWGSGGVGENVQPRRQRAAGTFLGHSHYGHSFLTKPEREEGPS